MALCLETRFSCVYQDASFYCSVLPPKSGEFYGM